MELNKRTMEFPMLVKCKLVFSLIILLVACPVHGQVNYTIKAHIENKKVILGIPNQLLHKEMLFVRHDLGYKQVVWTKQNNFLRLELPSIKSQTGVIITEDAGPYTKNHIIADFPILEGKGDENIHFIDITSLFIYDEINWYTGYKNVDEISKVLVEEVQMLKNEVVVSVKRVSPKISGRMKTEIFYSFYVLPPPMKPRLFDYRMGFNTEDQVSSLNYSLKNEKAAIRRWRLEKKDKRALLSEPLEPITFFLDPKTPEKWKPYIKAGIMEWLPAFEAAGFMNAIVVKDGSEALGGSQSNVNTSMIVWDTKEGVRGYEGGYGSTVKSIVDFRSGEILKADIIFKESYQKLTDEYIIRCAPLDKRVQHLPLPDELMGLLIQTIIAHEAGHAFGIKDANYGEYTYPFEKVRDKDWLQRMGHTPSVMNYTRHNFVVQPEDSIPPKLLIQHVGPTDFYQIKWGYQEFTGDLSIIEEKKQLEKWIQWQDSIPWFRYQIGEYEVKGPGATDEVMDNNNPIESIRLGLKNMKRTLSLLPEITKEEQDNEMLKRLYQGIIDLWLYQMKQPVSLIGGYDTSVVTENHMTVDYIPISKSLQDKGLEFLIDNAFQVPEWLSNPSFINRIQYSTYNDRLLENQKRLLLLLLRPTRMKRIAFQNTLDSTSNFMTRFFSKLQDALFLELDTKNENINSRRMELQKYYIHLLVKAIHQQHSNGKVAISELYLYSDYAKVVFLASLKSLKKKLEKKKSMIKNVLVEAHVNLCLARINRGLAID
ncbi:zinc-dependent metalloprotease [Flavobacteriaceae bacterium F08102]|nr:zinc-dependent metalloprotease [Flavobacteriaceae bacterium F08102]